MKNFLITKPPPPKKMINFRFLDRKWEPKWFCHILWVVLHCATPSMDDKSLIANVLLRTGGNTG